MRKKNIAALIMMCSLLCACGSNIPAPQTTETPVINETAVDNTKKATPEMIANNRTIISNALKTDEDKRSIHFILNSLDVIGVTQITEAEVAEENGEKVLDLISDSQKRYRFYLSDSDSVEAVKDLDSGAWLIKSER